MCSDLEKAFRRRLTFGLRSIVPTNGSKGQGTPIISYLTSVSPTFALNCTYKWLERSPFCYPNIDRRPHERCRDCQPADLARQHKRPKRLRKQHEGRRGRRQHRSPILLNFIPIQVSEFLVFIREAQRVLIMVPSYQQSYNNCSLGMLL